MVVFQGGNVVVAKSEGVLGLYQVTVRVPGMLHVVRPAGGQDQRRGKMNNQRFEHGVQGSSTEAWSTQWTGRRGGGREEEEKENKVSNGVLFLVPGSDKGGEDVKVREAETAETTLVDKGEHGLHHVGAVQIIVVGDVRNVPRLYPRPEPSHELNECIFFFF